MERHIKPIKNAKCYLLALLKHYWHNSKTRLQTIIQSPEQSTERAVKHSRDHLSTILCKFSATQNTEVELIELTLSQNSITKYL